MTTYHNDNSRTGANTSETALTPQNVNSSTFGKLYSHSVDGQVYAQPLYVPHVLAADGRYHNLLIVATENDSVYAFDADNPTAGRAHNGLIWERSYANPNAGVTAVPYQDVQVTDINPTLGITATPAAATSSNALYFVTKVKVQKGGTAGPQYVQQIHEVALGTGREKATATIGATTLLPSGDFVNATTVKVAGTGAGSADGVVAFNALSENSRPGLALDTSVSGSRNGVIFASFGSQGDIDPYHGWVVGFDSRTLKQYDVFNTTPDGNFGAVWQSGAAPAIAPNGDLLLTVGNGTFYAAAGAHASGAQALGDPGTGLGYAGITDSVAVTFSNVLPYSGHSATGLYDNGVTPVSQPLAPSTFQPLDGTGIDFNAGANNPAGPDTYQASLTYNGTTLSETITDQTTGASYSRNYTGVNLPATVGGNTAYVGFSGGTDGRQLVQDITSWTYSVGGQTVVDHSAGFASDGDLTANGTANFTGTMAELTNPGPMSHGEQAGTVFTNTPVDIRGFSTTFTFTLAPGSMPTQSLGDGLAFVVQNSQGHPVQPDYGLSTLRLQPTPGTLKVASSFTPFDFVQRDNLDHDLGSTSTLLLPSFPGTAHPDLVVFGDKSGRIYLADANALGGFTPGGPDNVVQELQTDASSFYGGPAYANGMVYFWGTHDVLRAYSLQLNPATNTMQLVAAGQGTMTSGYPGAVPSISSNGASNGIVWTAMVDGYMSGGSATLMATNPTNPSQVYYSSDQAGNRDTAGGAVKFTTPTVAAGKVFLGASYEVDVYGLLPPRPSTVSASRRGA